MSLCALAGGALLHWIHAEASENAAIQEIALYEQLPVVVGGDGSAGLDPVDSPPPPPVLMPPVPPAPPVTLTAPGFHPGAPILIITACNGVPGSAHLRTYPSLAPEVVLGVIPQGEPVLLLGDRTWGDGEAWIHIRTANQQEGWIAACFERG